MYAKTIIAPLVGALVILIQLAFHVQIPDDTASQATTALIDFTSVASIVYGIFKNHK